VIAIQNDTVLIVVNIGRVLKIPIAAGDRERDQTVILPGRMVNSASISLIFHAESAFGIAAAFGFSGSCDGGRVFFRLRQIDCDIKQTVRGLRFPFQILFDTIPPDIIGIL
jgi:hypothetical protein